MSLEATITIAGHAIAVEVLDATRERRVTRKIVESLPAPVAEWPLTVEEIQARVEVVYASFRCKPTRADIAWAVAKTGDAVREETGRYLVRAVPTVEETRDILSAARGEAEDGLV